MQPYAIPRKLENYIEPQAKLNWLKVWQKKGSTDAVATMEKMETTEAVATVEKMP